MGWDRQLARHWFAQTEKRLSQINSQWHSVLSSLKRPFDSPNGGQLIFENVTLKNLYAWFFVAYLLFKCVYLILYIYIYIVI